MATKHAAVERRARCGTCPAVCQNSGDGACLCPCHDPPRSSPWGCTKCKTVVFIPEDANVESGVCTQQSRGCAGEIARMGEVEALGVRTLMEHRGIREQPWLTLVFAATPPATP